jgi:hypothetical protein
LAVTLVGHFWTADFFRVFGRRFFDSLVEHQISGGKLVIRGHRLLSFSEVRGYPCSNPVLEYAFSNESVYAIKVAYFDTCLAFGYASLDDLARTFVGFGKLEGFGESAKADMLEVYRREPERAYAYAITDSILTLLVQEWMATTHKEMYQALGLQVDIPALRSTQGSRLAEMIVRSIARAAEGSVVLSRKGKELSGGGAGKVSLGKLKGLLDKGSGDYIAEERLSQFGKQTGQTHGGLLFSRSPAEFFHAFPGMFRDIDLRSCYAKVMASMSLYAGRPVIHEPGSGGMTLKDAVEFVNEHAAGRDAWIIKVSGKITTFPNALVPSTKGALTNANYKSRAAKRRARTSRYGFAFDWDNEARKDTGNTAIYTDVIEAGVVAWATLLVIQALPPGWREEYENLEVDSILFYPKKMVADSGPGFDALVEEHRHFNTPWQASINMEALVQVIKKPIDDDYVAFRFDLGELVKVMLEKRREAKDRYGPGSAAEKGWKVQVNSLYGVVASRYLATNNIEAANYITATARALAFSMQMSLNGFQVITDGCTYRADQIPGLTFTDCLAACPDYPVNRGEFSGPFLDPAAIPVDDGFTTWYREHVKRFFGVAGAEYDWLFGLHALEHKKCGDPEKVPFDALCCDGSCNYVKLLKNGDGWKPIEIKARSFKKAAKEQLAEWLVQTYSTDRYAGPPPITLSSTLLTYNDAGRVARKAAKGLTTARYLVGEPTPATVYYPLGLEQRRIQAYKVIKPSAFLFRTPQQQVAFLNAMTKLTEATSCGLELLALRRDSKGRRRGSIADIAAMIYRLIRTGQMNPTKAMNLTRPFKKLEQLKEGHHHEVLARKNTALVELCLTLDESTMDKDTTLTGLFVDQRDIYRISPP